MLYMAHVIELHLTEEDMRHAHEFGFEGTLLSRLATLTGTLWRMSPCGVGTEVMAPHRTFILAPESREVWYDSQAHPDVNHCDLKIKIYEPNECVVEYSL